MGAVIRRLENNMITLGAGTIVFGVWGFAEGILYYNSMIPELAEESSYGEMIFITAFFVIVMGIDLLLKIIVGVQSRKVGKGGKMKISVLVMTVILFLIETVGLLAEIFSLVSLSGGILGTAVSILIDVTSLVFLVELFVSALRLNSLRNKRKEEAVNNEC